MTSVRREQSPLAFDYFHQRLDAFALSRWWCAFEGGLQFGHRAFGVPALDQSHREVVVMRGSLRGAIHKSPIQRIAILRLALFK